MLLAASKGTSVQLHCAGNDETMASNNITYLIKNRFERARVNVFISTY